MGSVRVGFFEDPLFKYLAPSESAEESLVSQIFTSWNPLMSWLRQVERLRHAA
jgi:hypothetical protein